MITDSLIWSNPVFVQLLGTCPTLAITTSLKNGIGMGLAVIFVLTCSNLVISLMKGIISPKTRIVTYILVIASFTTAADMLIGAYFPSLANSLGLFIPLIVVNCVVLARVESFAVKNSPVRALFDGLFMGAGFMGAICIVSFVRELLGAGSVYGHQIPHRYFNPASLILLPVGGFLILGIVIAGFNFIFGRGRDQ